MNYLLNTHFGKITWLFFNKIFNIVSCQLGLSADGSSEKWSPTLTLTEVINYSWFGIIILPTDFVVSLLAPSSTTKNISPKQIVNYQTAPALFILMWFEVLVKPS